MLGLIFCAAMTTAPLNLTVLTYNIRYGTAQDGENAWPNRREAVLERLADSKADVIALQEALKFQIDEIQAVLPGYTLVGRGRDDGKEKGEYSALLIHPRLRIKESGMFWLSETPDEVASKSWNTSITRVCSWARLEEGLTVASTHWDHVSDEARLNSGKLIAAKFSGEPLILMGDFNTDYKSSPMEALREAGLRDSWEVAHPGEKPSGTFTGFKIGSTTGAKIDGVWVSRHFDVKRAWIDDREGGKSYPSDHFPVGAELTLKG